MKDLDSDLSGDFKATILSLMMTPAEFDAYSLNKGMQGKGCDEDTLIEIICTRSESEIEEIKKKYKKGLLLDGSHCLILSLCFSNYLETLRTNTNGAYLPLSISQ